MKYKIIVDKQSRTNPSEEKREYEVDIEELRTRRNVYDSIVITRDEAYVLRKFTLSDLMVLSELEEPIKEPLSDLNIELFEGDNYIYLIDMTGNKFYAEYLIKNEFNELYVTLNQMNSAINQTAENIELTVNQKLKGYSTTEEMNAIIEVTANEINSEVSKKVGEDEIISKINQTAEEITIDANKLNINGVISANGNFAVDTNGNLNCSNAKISSYGGSNTGDSSGLNLKVLGDTTYEYSGFAPAFGIVRKGEDTYINFETKTDYAGLQIRADENHYISNTILSDMGLVNTLWKSPDYTTIVAPNGIQTPQVKIDGEGTAMYGKGQTYHRYRCYWTGSQLQFWVDETNVGTLSDKRLKTEIQDIDEDFINAIKEVEMKQFKVANRNGLVSFGILAQDLIEIFKKYNKNPFDYEIVQETQYRTDDDTVYYTINYEQYLILKSKVQEQEIEQLKIQEQEKDMLIKSLIERIEKLEVANGKN